MANYKIGYGRPPKSGQFRPGESGNPKGRPKRKREALLEIVEGILSAPMQYREKGKNKSASREEVAVRLLIERAIKGDVSAADLLLKVRTRALRRDGGGSELLEITDWLPDYPGQTGEQKTQDCFAGCAENAAQEPDVADQRDPDSGQRPPSGD